MTLSSTLLQPGDPGYLLGALSAARAKDLPDDAAVLDAKRRLVLAFAGSALVVPTNADGLPLTVLGTTGELVLTFTDGEAARAYFEARGIDPDAHPAMALDDRGTDQGGLSTSFDDFRRAEPRVVLVNPAGPDGTLIAPEEFRRFRPRRFFKRLEPVPASAFSDDGMRVRARADSRQRIAALGEAVLAGDWERFGSLTGTDDETNPIGSLEYMVALQHLAGVKKLRRGDDPRVGLRQLVWGIVHYASSGFPERAVDGALNNADLLLDTARSTHVEPDWAWSQVGAVADLLELLDLDRRRQETQAFISAARQSAPADDR